MALTFIGKDPGSEHGNSPTVWVDETTHDFVIQGWKPDEVTLAGCGTVPGHEAVIRVPSRMTELLRKACDAAGA